MSKVPFPSAGVSEVTIIRVHSPKGLFAYRYSQALGLLHPPDYGGGDLSREDRRKALDQSVVLHRPLTALVVFLSVVALERTSYEDSATNLRVSMGSQPTSQIFGNSGFGFVPPPLRARHTPGSMMSRFGTSTSPK
jgi:hypothetical protein